MLTDDLLAQILDTNLQISAAGWAFLNKVRVAWHIGISCYRRDPPTTTVRWRFNIHKWFRRINHLLAGGGRKLSQVGQFVARLWTLRQIKPVKHLNNRSGDF